MLNYTEKPQNTLSKVQWLRRYRPEKSVDFFGVGVLWRHTRRIWGMGQGYYNCIPTLSLDVVE